MLQSSTAALSALIQAMNEEELGAVARKVYSYDRGLALVLLSPVREVLHDGGSELYKEVCLFFW